MQQIPNIDKTIFSCKSTLQSQKTISYLFFFFKMLFKFQETSYLSSKFIFIFCKGFFKSLD